MIAKKSVYLIVTIFIIIMLAVGLWVYFNGYKINDTRVVNNSGPSSAGVGNGNTAAKISEPNEKNSPQAIIDTKASSVICAANCQDADFGLKIRAFTDKNNYYQKEEITITLANESDVSIESLAASYTAGMGVIAVYRQNGDEWERLAPHCGWPDCDIDADGPRQLEAGKSNTFSWYPQYYDSAKKQDFDLGPGNYHLGIEFSLGRGGYEAITNDFSIME